MKVTVPRKYGLDAVERGLDIGEVVRVTARHITLECTAAQLAELRSDAEYYADEVGFSDHARGYCRSARAALKALPCRIGSHRDE